MSKNTKHLPIYKASYALVKLISSSTKDFSRAYRPTLGAQMNAEAMALVLSVFRANAALHKAEYIRDIQKGV